MQTEHIVTLFSLIVIIGGLGYLRRRHRRTFTQTAAIPTWPETERERRGYAEQMRVAQIVSDARLILYRQYRGQPASRRHMERVGVSARRWKRAVILLRNLGIYARDGYAPVASEHHTQRKLERFQRTHAARIATNPAAYVSAN